MKRQAMKMTFLNAFIDMIPLLLNTVPDLQEFGKLAFG